MLATEDMEIVGRDEQTRLFKGECHLSRICGTVSHGRGNFGQGEVRDRQSCASIEPKA